MKKSKWWASLSLALVMSTGLAVAVGQSDKVMQRQSDGTYVVNTVTLCPTVRGFKGATPCLSISRAARWSRSRPSATKRARSFPEGETGPAAQVCGHETQYGSQSLGGRWRDGRDDVEPGREEKRGGRREILSGAQVAAGEKPYGRRTSRPVLMRSEPGVASVVCVVEATEPVVLRATESRLSGPH